MHTTGETTTSLSDDLFAMDGPTDPPDPSVATRARRTSWTWELREIVAGAVLTVLAFTVAIMALVATGPDPAPRPTARPLAGAVTSLPGAGLPGIAVVIALGR